MSQQNKKAKSWEVLTVRKKLVEDKKTKAKKPVTYFVFDKSFKATVNGQEIDLGEYMTAYLRTKEEMIEDLNYKLSQGWITESDVEKSIQRIEEKGIVGSIKVNLK